MTEALGMEGLGPESQAAQQAMIKLLATPPETILSLFERLEIPWARVNPGDSYKVENGPVFIVQWKDLMEGESRNQEAGPFIRKLFEELKDQFGPGVAAEQAAAQAKAEPEVVVPEVYKNANSKKNRARTVDPEGTPEF